MADIPTPPTGTSSTAPTAPAVSTDNVQSRGTTDSVQPRIPRTHTSPAIIQLLKNLSLTNILQRNKTIEAENDARSAKTLNNALDPAAHPQPGSEVASLITIDPEDLARLRSLYDTEHCVAVPLPFFLTQNLRSLVDEVSTLPTVKSNPAPGETKGIYILNIDKLSNRFGKELTLTCSQWSKAAANMWNFQISRDKSGSEGEHATWFEKHFNFFNMLNKRDELYDARKVMELEFRQDHRSRHLKFSATDYDRALGLTEETHKLRKEFHDVLNSSQAATGQPPQVLVTLPQQH
ncbi:uncharacterized protein LACBIDRAFT_327093 [Laccaria bicolor S238N-H82]|uniref:Predicted protein n=1 Tax=Laccaria bicolor (strain S238N-H82 / ATCC MYA-4686) TaxID=486041 RepID=B0DAM4_LACBS|nr:uncharacterized protein LACBIDRAFT_327093 [Laccaria bicolor S238N-H82]EDR08774.1 predicted protein [Laccaria bicolor S238N-H82]|eukprot:XP_001880999.1 predicted protein [Laccaria bicolor S238N-H82]